MSRTAAPKQSRKSAAGSKNPTPLSFSVVNQLFDCKLAKWPAQIVPGETYTVPMDTDDRQRVYQRFHHAGHRWQVEFDVRVIGNAAMFRMDGKPSRRGT